MEITLHEDEFTWKSRYTRMSSHVKSRYIRTSSHGKHVTQGQDDPKIMSLMHRDELTWTYSAEENHGQRRPMP